jgi:hypothetical protein
MNDFGLVKAIDGLGQGVVIAVADAADQEFDAGFGQELGIIDGQVLRPRSERWISPTQ